MSRIRWALELLASNQNLVDTETFANTELLKKMETTFEKLQGTCCSKEKAKLIIEIILTEKLYLCVEVGTFLGSSALPILVAIDFLKKGHIYLIDAWSNEEAIKGLDIEDQNTHWWAELNMNAIKTQLFQMIKKEKASNYTTILHKNSEEALLAIDSIDFLHLDGNFSEKGSFLDTSLYLPKVKKKGYILLSNALAVAFQKPSKLKTIDALFDSCEIISEIDRGNTFLFRKRGD